MPLPTASEISSDGGGHVAFGRGHDSASIEPRPSSPTSERPERAADNRDSVDAFDADVLIYAAVPDHRLGRRVRALFPSDPVERSGLVAGMGSVLLIPELLSKPLRERATDELDELGALLSRLDLLPADEATAELATALGAVYSLRAADAIHLATAIGGGAERFLTNNRADFPKTIREIDITYPEDLPDP